jgi:hypothetical protein
MMSKWMVGEQNLRPAFPSNFPVPLQLLVEACWTDKPASRPTFANIQQALQSEKVKWFETNVEWFEAATPATPTVQEWLKGAGLESKLDVVVAYVSNAETVADEGFREFAQDGDDYLEEMVEEGDLTEDEAAKLKGALHALNEADPPQGWHALCELLDLDRAAGEVAGDAAKRVQQLEAQLAKQNKLTEELKAQLA